ncbi:hypothetical protein G7046_g8004 [Stylonectria norvegica]|nr:hypothetical protein G7046_g8004 [Stylonectria norvegica]
MNPSIRIPMRAVTSRLHPRGPLLHRNHVLQHQCSAYPSSHIKPPSFSSRASPPKRSYLLPLTLLITVSLAGTATYLLLPPSRPNTLNERTFVPYTITNRDAISPTSFILTVTPHTPNPSPSYLDASARWRYPLWSVEFKQPEVQISRHYTPLPPLTDDDGALRFYVRTVGDGEMSNYLWRRRVGEEVHLRGPHVGFDLLQMLGRRGRVVFLAGGTGVVPGMQAAKAALDADELARVDLLWAVRKREEIQAEMPPREQSWRFWRADKPSTELDVKMEGPSAITQRLNAMKALYGSRLNVQIVVDEEGSRIDEADVSKSLLAAPGTSLPSSSGCRFHDQRLLENASEFAAAEGPPCACGPSDAGAGKNILVVSGPEGFVARYAGPKVWLGGQQTQGAVGGLVGRLLRRHPEVAREWLVLKL